MSTATFGLQNIFSAASRERCMANLLKFRIPPLKKGIQPTSTAAVLMPLCGVNDVSSLLYTVRSSALKSHSGQISFPGGKTDKGETSIETALREAHEEIGLPPDKVDIWGSGQAVPGRDFNIMITPVVGCIADLKERDLIINESEVNQVFTVPLQTLCDPKNQFYTQFKNGFVLPVFVTGEYKIWGITAYMTHMFLSCLLPKDSYHNDWTKKKMELKDIDSKITNL